MKKAFLFMLGLFATIGMQAQTSPYTGSEVGEGEFYLYNVGTGLWIQNIDANNRRSNDNWNTGAGMGTAGFDFTLTAVDGGYNLDPKENPRKLGWGYGDGGILYLDGNIGGNTHWDFTPVDGVSNGYKISIEDHVLGVEASGGKFFLINNATENDVWQLVTKAERLEKMQGLVADKPYDLSFLLGDWNFAENNLRRSQWVERRDGGNDDGFPRGRRWNSSHLVWNTNSYSWTQTVSDLPDGCYQFSVQGMFRDGHRDQVGAKAANGQTNLIAKYFIGALDAPLKSVLAEASETQGDGFETPYENTNPQLYAPDNANNWSIVWALHPDKYWNEPIKVNVRGGSVELGVRKTSRIDGDWIAMNEFKLEYVGPIDSSLDKVALKNAVDAAKAFTGNTSNALATALATALSEAEDALENATELDVIAAKANALTAALLAAEAVDVTYLKATIPFAEADGVDCAAAKDAAENATDAATVNNALNAIRIARQLKHADTHENVWNGNEPAEGDFYIYNVGQKRFLCGGDDWGAHAALGFPGVAISLIKDGDNYKFDTHLNNGGTSEYLNYGGYMDTPDQNGWYFQEVGEGVYNIVRGENHSQLLGYSANTLVRVDTDKSDGADPNNQWILVSKADRDALIAGATKDNPVDVSYLIQSPGFNQREAIDRWGMEGYSIWNRGGNNPDFICESWNTPSNSLGQTIENLAPGLYEVSVQGYYRDGDTNQQVVVANDRAQLATFSANGVSVLLPNILEGLDQAPGLGNKTEIGEFPDNANQAANFFRNGLYKNTLKVLVGEDGKLEIKISKDQSNFERDWVVVDNFRLAYLGNDETDIAYERALADIKDGAVYRVKTEIGGETYYVDPTGKLTTTPEAAGGFQLEKVKGEFVEYGFKMKNGAARFTNAPLNNNSAVLEPGQLSVTTGNDRNTWEAQAFFLNAEGKYAIRTTNVAYGESGWADAGRVFWTVSDAPQAMYSYNKDYIWELEYICNAEEMAARVAAAQTVATWVNTIQAAKGLVKDASMYISNAKDPSEGSYEALLDGDYESYFHSTWHASNDPQADHYLQAELPDAAQEFYFYFKKRSQNNNNRPTKIVVSGSNDGENFTEITTITEGLPTDGSVIDYLSSKIAGNEAYQYIRFTVPTTNNGAKTGDHVFFTFSEFYILPSMTVTDDALAMATTQTYLLDPARVQEVDAALKAAMSTVNVTYALYDVNGAEPIKTKTVVVEANSEVQVPSDFTSIAYYDYTVEGEIADVDCTIKVFRSMKNGVVHQLSDLSNDKAYTIRCDRGALLTKDDYLASTAHNSLTSAEPADFALISYEDNIYLYSVADKKFVQNNGALAEMPSNGVFDAVQMEAKTDPYFFTYFKISDSKNYGLNTNGNDPYGYVINDWMNADAGNQYYMIESSEFDATEALAALEAYFHPSYFVTYVVKDAEGTELFKSEPQPAREGDKITTLPADFQRAFTTYDEVDVTVAEAETTVEFTATSTFPFEISASFDEAKWYNMTIRSDYYVAMDENEPYYPKTDKDLDAPESQWAFAGDAYNGIVVMNKAAGEGWSLTKDGDNVVMREGAYAWTIGANADGFTLREIGTDNNCVNQNGGASGPLQFWNNAGSLADNGSTFRVTEVVVPEPVILNAPTWSVADGTQAEPNMLSAATPLLITYTADNVEENGYNPDDLKVKVTVVVSGDLPENMMTMGSQTAHRVLGESFYIPLGEAEFPVALKLGYVYQNIVVTAAQLVANAETDAEEVIASYAGAPAQLHWIGKEEISMAQEMTITSTVGSFYEGLSADAPMADILLALGAESLEGVEIFALLPDDTRDPNYQLGTTDGWRDADGNWKAWADGPDFFIKANFELPSGQIYEAGGYPGKTNEEKTFTAKYVFVKGEAEVTLTVNLVYEPAPTVDIDFSDLAVQGEPIVIEKTSPVGSSYEGFKADVDIASILTTLGVQSLDDVDIFAVQSDESLDPNYGVGTTDGWRNADGDWQSWGADARLCVKADFTTASEQIYYIGGMDGQTSASGSYSAIFAFVKKNSETHEAVVLQVKLTYTASDAQMALEEEIANAEGLIEESQNAELYDQDNAALSAAVATLNDAIDAAKAKLGTTDDEMIAATNALKEAEDAFKSALTAIYGINADQLNGTIYDLGGRKIQKVQRGGVYIVNGKKVAVK